MNYDNMLLHKTYRKGRELSPETAALWMNAVADFLPRDGKVRILDLGCGTGRFAVPLATCFDAFVIGIEPSRKMLAEATVGRSGASVAYAVGCAEAVPLAAESFDAAFLSQVIHHLRDLSEACAQLRDLLRPGGILFVRNGFKDRADAWSYCDFFPTATALDRQRLPSVQPTVEAFEAAGFQPLAHRIITQQTDASLRAHYERMKLRAVSTLLLISDDEFQEGIRALERAAAAEVEPQPVMDSMDFLVFKKPGPSDLQVIANS
jgi:SAM-dependent methyltransferase